MTLLPDDAATEWVPLDRIHPWPGNPRRIPPEAVAAVARSIEAHGWGAPILARRADGEIVACHTRHLAARHLGLDRVLVRWLDVSVETARRLARSSKAWEAAVPSREEEEVWA